MMIWAYNWALTYNAQTWPIQYQAGYQDIDGPEYTTPVEAGVWSTSDGPAFEHGYLKGAHPS